MFLRPLAMHLSFKTRCRHYSDKNKNLIRKERIKMEKLISFLKSRKENVPVSYKYI